MLIKQSNRSPISVIVIALLLMSILIKILKPIIHSVLVIQTVQLLGIEGEGPSHDLAQVEADLGVELEPQ